MATPKAQKQIDSTFTAEIKPAAPLVASGGDDRRNHNTPNNNLPEASGDLAEPDRPEPLSPEQLLLQEMISLRSRLRSILALRILSAQQQGDQTLVRILLDRLRVNQAELHYWTQAASYGSTGSVIWRAMADYHQIFREVNAYEQYALSLQGIRTKLPEAQKTSLQNNKPNRQVPGDTNKSTGKRGKQTLTASPQKAGEKRQSSATPSALMMDPINWTGS